MKRILLISCLVLGILFIIGSIILSICFGFTFGTCISFFLGILLVLGYFLYHKFSPKIRRLLRIIILSGLLFSTLMISFIIVKGSRQTVTFGEDAVLVLGCGIKGKAILPQLQDRLDRCVEYLQKNPTAIIIVSGGQGRNEDIPEADAMKNYLIDKGIESNQIIKENLSSNTAENMQFSKPLLDSCFRVAEEPYTVVCITSDYHSYRAMKLAREYNISATNYNAGVRWYLRPAAYIREMFSICKYWFSIL